MTSITVPNKAHQVGRSTLLRISLSMALIIATAASIRLADIPAAPSAEAAPVGVATTTASEQYTGWFLRPSDLADAPAGTSASEQYTDWHTRPSFRAGSTTAGEQYRAWYTRDGGSS